MCSLYLPMKKYSFCITFTATAYSTIDTTVIHHVYKPLLSAFLFAPADPFAIKSAPVFGLVFFRVNANNLVMGNPVVINFFFRRCINDETGSVDIIFMYDNTHS